MKPIIPLATLTLLGCHEQRKPWPTADDFPQPTPRMRMVAKTCGINFSRVVFSEDGGYFVIALSNEEQKDRRISSCLNRAIQKTGLASFKGYRLVVDDGPRWTDERAKEFELHDKAVERNAQATVKRFQ